MQLYYDFGLKVDSAPIPDPSSFEYTVSDLDLSGERDSNGYLKREYVATKHNMKIKYDALRYSTVQEILGLLASPAFQFTFYLPDTNELYTSQYYVGDRTMNVINAWDAVDNWLCDLSFDLIEY